MNRASLSRVLVALGLLGAFLVAPAPQASAASFGDMVDYPLTFPVAGKVSYSDSFYAYRVISNYNNYHHAQDLMADKMTPVVAAGSGTVYYVNGTSNPSWDGGRCCTLRIRHDDGWTSVYIHLNNDTPGTDDGQGWGIAPGIEIGSRVEAGQLIGWVGDSGNAENTAPHLHFELHDPDGVIVNPYNALRAAEGKTPAPVCKGPEAVSVAALVGGTGLLKLGSTGEEVRQLQSFLTAVGYDTGPADGVLGPLTSGAIRAFQEGRGLVPDGVVGSKTRSAVQSVSAVLPAIPVLDQNNRIIRPGFTGGDVGQLQSLLKVAGYDPGPADGVYGPMTEAAVTAFQESYGSLTVDGKVGPNTREALAAYLGIGDFQACR